MTGKGKIKDDSKQLILIKTLPTERSTFWKIFCRQPPSNGWWWIESYNACLQQCLQFSWSFRDDLRQCFAGVCFDGQYIHLNIRKHLSTILKLPAQFLEDSLTHDSAYKLGLACADVKNGKVDENGDLRHDENRLVICHKTEWLIELNTLSQSIITHFCFGHNHTELHKIGSEKNEDFLEFNLFSTTDFVEYGHRTYDHFVCLYHLLY